MAKVFVFVIAVYLYLYSTYYSGCHCSLGLVSHQGGGRENERDAGMFIWTTTTGSGIIVFHFEHLEVVDGGGFIDFHLAHISLTSVGVGLGHHCH